MAEESAHRDMPEASVPFPQPQLSNSLPIQQPFGMPQSIYRGNIGIMEGLFNKLKSVAGFGNSYAAYYPGNTFAQPFLSQPNLSQAEEMMKQQQMAMPMPTNPAVGIMSPMNYYQQQQQAQQLLEFYMMMNQQQQPYFQQQQQQQIQQMMQYQLMQQQQQQQAMATMGIQQRFSPLSYPPMAIGSYPQQQYSYYSQQQSMYPYEDYSRNPSYSSYYDTRYTNNSLYPPRTNRFSSVKDLRPY